LRAGYQQTEDGQTLQNTEKQHHWNK